MGISFFDQPRKTLDWTWEGLKELKAVEDAFFRGQKYTRIKEIDPETGEEVHKARLSDPIPREFERKAAEALSNTRNSFDQSIFAACRSLAQSHRKSVYFPWATNPTDLSHRLNKIPTELWDALREHEPYGRGEGYTGGNDLIREIAHIANRKHTIGFKIGGQVSGVRIPGPIKLPSEGLLTTAVAASHWDAVKNEIEIIRCTPGAEFSHQYKIALYIAFDEAVPLRNKSVGSCLMTFLHKAQQVLVDLEKRCIEVGSS